MKGQIWKLCMLSVFLLPSVAVCTPLTTNYTGGPTQMTIDGVLQPVPWGHVHGVSYVVNEQNWTVWLNPDPAEFLPGTAGNFFDVLSAEFTTDDGWVYKSSLTPLSDNSLVVHTYTAIHDNGVVGAQFLVEYVPHGTDPTDGLHWIQVITDDDPENEVDQNNGHDPFYDNGGTATDRLFHDNSYRNDAKRHKWRAELFLVAGPPLRLHDDGTTYADPGTVTFYGGIRWGWQNDCYLNCHDGSDVPEPATWILMASSLVLLIAWRSPLLRREVIRSVGISSRV